MPPTTVSKCQTAVTQWMEVHHSTENRIIQDNTPIAEDVTPRQIPILNM